MYFLVNAFPNLLDIATSNFAVAYVLQCRGYWATAHVTLTKVKCQILYYLVHVHASTSNSLGVATSNSEGA